MIKDVIVVGGGVIGCSIALKLSLAGLSVSVVERGRIGCEASRAAAGMLSPQTDATSGGPLFQLGMRSRSMYPDFIARLRDDFGADVPYRGEGTICVARDDGDLDEFLRWTSWQLAAGFEIEHLSAAQVRQAEPAVAPSARGGVLVPNDHQVDNRSLMDALDSAIRRAGVEVVERSEVTEIATSRDRVTGVICDGHVRASGAVVVAAGCWSSSLLRRLNPEVSVTPVRGQMLALKAEGPPIAHTLHSKRCYLVPREDNLVLVGATLEYVGFTKALTAGGMGSLLSAAIELAPSLAGCELVELWCGLRPDTPDHLPMIGPAGIDRLWLATGHFRNGILLAPATAELLAEAILGGASPRELEPFSVARFLQR